MKIIVPPGFMPVVADGRIAMEACSGFGPEQMTAAMPGMAHDTDHSGKGSVPCGFGGHAPPSLTMVDPILLALALAFIVTLASKISVVPVARPTAFLRPQLRGPPTIR